MINNLKNKLVVHGTGEQVKEVLNFLQIKKAEDNEVFYGLGAVDFNKIVPTPDHIISGNIADEGEMNIGINFVTAWYPVIEQMVDLSAKFTSVIIDYGWSDYQLGDIIGRVKIKAGKIDKEGTKIPEVGTKEIDELSEWIFS